MRLDENIHRIKEVMGLITEAEQPSNAVEINLGNLFESGKYKYLADENGNWDQLNMLDTNLVDGPNYLEDLLKRKKNILNTNLILLNFRHLTAPVLTLKVKEKTLKKMKSPR